MSTKYDLPNNLVSELSKLQELFALGSNRTSSGSGSWTSSSSGTTYSYTSGTQQLFQNLQTTLTPYQITANDWNTLVLEIIPAGEIKYFARKTAPDGYLKADGSAIPRSTYSRLFDAICPPATFTVTIASPAVITSTAHGLSVGDPIRLSTTGALPTGLGTSTTYYVISAGFGANSFQVSTSVGGAAVNTSGSQSGTHTLRPYYYGIGDGSTTFNLPDLRGEFIRGYDDGRNVDSGRVLGSSQNEEFKSHNHRLFSTPNSGDTANGFGSTITTYTNGGVAGLGKGSYGTAYYNTNASNNVLVENAGGIETRPRNIALLACIRY